MRFLALFVLLTTTSACANLGLGRRSGPTPNANIEQLYARGLALLDTGVSSVAIDSAAGFLEAYLAYTGYVARRDEARVLLRLAADARQLQRVEAALQEAQAAPDTVYKAVPGRTGGRDDDAALREISRLKDALAKANAELERIRKRLANPPPTRPPGS